MSRLTLFGGSALPLLPTALAAQSLSIPLGNSSIVPQVAPTPAPSSTPAPTPTPTPFPSPVVPAPVATPAAPPMPAAAAVPTPRPGSAATGGASARTDRARREAPPATAPEPLPRPAVFPAAAPTPTPAASPTPIETVVLPQPQTATAPLWPWFAGGAVVLLALAALLLRRREPTEQWDEPVDAEATAAPPPDPEPLPPEPRLFTRAAPSANAARLALALRPTRAGINLLTATVDAEVVVTNTGTAPANDIRAAVALTGATGSEAPTIAAIAGQPIAKPDTPPFALGPGEEKRFRVVAALPLDMVPALSVANRPLFVPLVVVTAQWREGEGARRTTRGFAVGVERVDSAKLAPLWLDVPPRTYDGVAARPHGEEIETG